MEYQALTEGQGWRKFLGFTSDLKILQSCTTTILKGGPSSHHKDASRMSFPAKERSSLGSRELCINC